MKASGAYTELRQELVASEGSFKKDKKVINLK